MNIAMNHLVPMTIASHKGFYSMETVISPDILQAAFPSSQATLHLTWSGKDSEQPGGVAAISKTLTAVDDC